MTHARPKRVAAYARLSVSTEESVSIRRQIEACHRYAEARGWIVVATEVDDGVSASRLKPEERPGWRAILNHSEKFDAVVVWKVDRLARRVLDFLHAHEALADRGAAIVAVDDPVDMTTPTGMAFTQMLAVFAELEAAFISVRVRAARRTILGDGRRAGGRPPFGWMNVDNPDGPGKVLAFDPERIDVVRTMVDLVLAGGTLYSVRRWLEDQGVEPRKRQGASGAWFDASIEAILRNPVLAGMAPYTPGRKPGEEPDPWSVVRDAHGLPVVDESVAIISTDERRTLLSALDAAKKPGTRTRGGAEPALLQGLIVCGVCESPLHRGLGNGRRQYRCSNRACSSRPTVLRDPVEQAVEEVFLAERGNDLVVRLAEVGEPVPSRLGDIEEAIAQVTAELAADGVDEVDAMRRLRNLKEMREEARAQAEGAATRSWTYDSQTYRQAWEATESVEERNNLLRSALSGISIRPALKRGQRFDKSRIEFRWLENQVRDGLEVRQLRGAPFQVPRR